MTTEDNEKIVYSYSQQTIDILAKYNIPPNPRAYEVWYAYIANNNIEISKAIDTLLDAGELPDREFTDQLYVTALSSENYSHVLDTTSMALSNQMNNISSSISDVDSDTELFVNVLSKYGATLKETDNPAEIIEKMAQATHKFQASVQGFGENIESLQSEITKLKYHLSVIREEVNIDPLTLLASKKCYDQTVSKEIRKSIEVQTPLCLLMIEVDHYSAFKEKWKQITAEQILCYISEVLKDNTKGRDTACRYSESCFTVILPQTHLEGAKTLANHIRTNVERKRIVKKNTGEFLGRITLSIGIVKYNESESIGQLLRRLDKTLYAAQISGRNCTITEDEAHNILESEGSSNKENKVA